MKANNTKYCTYVRFHGIVGWFQGWFLIGIADEDRISGYGPEYLANFLGQSRNCDLRVVAIQPPLKHRSWFLPKDNPKTSRITTNYVNID